MRKTHYKAFDLLHEHDQTRIRREWEPRDRTNGWERPEKWAFPVRNGRLVSGDCMEPAYKLDGTKIERFWTAKGGIE